MLFFHLKRKTLKTLPGWVSEVPAR